MDEQHKRMKFDPEQELVGASDEWDMSLSHNQTIQRLFEKRAYSTPDAIALVCPERHLTYSQLNNCANHFSRVLLTLGIRSDQRVGVFAERSIETVIGFLAVLKAGGAYVPLSPEYPIERLMFMIEDSSLTAILVQKSFEKGLPSSGLPVFSLEAVAEGRYENPVVAGLRSSSSAYVIYTSGSTGTPKGVIVEHRNVLGLVENSAYATLGPADCVAHCSNPSFDATTWEVWATLLTGARLIVVPPAVLLEPASLDDMLTQQAVTAMFLTVGLFNEYVDKLEKTLEGLKYLLIGGEVVNPGTIRRALSKPKPPENLINAYGPTETTTFACTFRVSGTIENSSTIPIGNPISNTQVFILNDSGQPVQVGEVGEIFIGGSGVARGYLNRAKMTAERFPANRFPDKPGERIYRTGDLARWRSDRQIEYVGRADNQVKIRGYRIELEEVEAQLARHEHVQNVVVIVREDNHGEKRLIAYLTLRFLDALRVTELRVYLKRVLPEYMIPEAFVLLHKIPLTSNGKVDRRALPEPNSEDYACAQFASPEGSVEHTLAELWQELLHAKCIGRNDDFFALGGNSIKVVKMIARVEARFVRLSVLDVFRNPTVRTLAQVICMRQLHCHEHRLTESAATDEFTL